jgi:hypothetical protein
MDNTEFGLEVPRRLNINPTAVSGRAHKLVRFLSGTCVVLSSFFSIYFSIKLFYSILSRHNRFKAFPTRTAQQVEMLLSEEIVLPCSLRLPNRLCKVPEPMLQNRNLRTDS